MQNQFKKQLPPFTSVSSKPITFLNVIFGVFGISFLLFFFAGMIFVLTYSQAETGLDSIASVALFVICFFAFVSFTSLLFYYRKRMYTTTIIDEKGIRYINKFNNKILKDLPWNSFAKKEHFEYFFEPPKYDVNANTPMKSIFDQFSWPVVIDGKVIVNRDAFMGKHIFGMFYSNRSELIRTFLLGIAHYRHDITIDPAIFTSRNISTETYVVNYQERRKIGIITGFFCVGILVLLYFWVFC